MSPRQGDFVLHVEMYDSVIAEDNLLGRGLLGETKIDLTMQPYCDELANFGSLAEALPFQGTQFTCCTGGRSTNTDAKGAAPVFDKQTGQEHGTVHLAFCFVKPESEDMALEEVSDEEAYDVTSPVEEVETDILGLK